MAGAIQAIAPHPTDPNIIYVGSVNGGVWKATNTKRGTDTIDNDGDGLIDEADPSEAFTWVPMTDQFASLSISDIIFDPSDSTHQTLYASTGQFSSSARGGTGIGILKTTNGGRTWEIVGRQLTGQNITALEIVVQQGPPSQTVLLATALDSGTTFTKQGLQNINFNGRGGIFRSVDGGFTFAHVNQSSFGTPLNGDATDIVAGPDGTVYAALPGEGIFRSNDTGAAGTWTEILSMNGLITEAGPLDKIEETVASIKLAMNDASGVLYAGIIQGTLEIGSDFIIGNMLTAVYRSPDRGDNWVNMGIPVTTPDPSIPTYTPGLHFFRQASPDGIDNDGDGVVDEIEEGLRPAQGLIHFSISAHPTDPNVVYIGGDRQPGVFDVAPTLTSNSPTPNPTGNTGRLFMGEFIAGSTFWRPITDDGANGTAPHVDSRDMVFDADGNLLEADDGGIFKLTNPLTSAADYMTPANTSFWLSLNKGLRTAEIISIGYDTVHDVIFAGTQDNSSPEQGLNGPKNQDGIDNDKDGFTDEADERLFWDLIKITSDPDALQGDGGTQLSVPGPSLGEVLRFSMGNTFTGFWVRTIGAGGSLISESRVTLAKSNGMPGVYPTEFQFDGLSEIPYVVNSINPTRMLIGIQGLYESKNIGSKSSPQYDFLQVIKPAKWITRSGPANDASRIFSIPRYTALVFGGMNSDGTPNEGLIYAAKDNKVFVKESANKVFRKYTVRTSSPRITAETIQDIVVDPDDASIAYVIDSKNVFRTSDFGRTWALFGKLPDNNLQSLEIVKLSSSASPTKVLLVGGGLGVYRAAIPTSGQPVIWTELGQGLPNALVVDMIFDSDDDRLIVGTLGRGAWTIENVSSYLILSPLLTVRGGANADDFLIQRSVESPLFADIYHNGLMEYSGPISFVGGIEIFGGNGDDSLTVNLDHGAINVPFGIHYDGEGNEAGGDSLSIIAQNLAGFSTDTNGNETTRRFWEENGLVQLITSNQNLENQPNPIIPNELKGIHGGLEVLASSGTGYLIGDEGLPGFGGIERALSGVDLSQPTPLGGNFGQAQVLAGASEPGSDVLRRLFETGLNAVFFSEIGNTIQTAGDLVTALDALDNEDPDGNPIPGNVGNVSELNGVYTVAINNKILSGTADLDLNLLDGLIDVFGTIDISANVTLNIQFGVDDAGFFINPGYTASEIVVNGLQVSGGLRAGGEFGILNVVMSEVLVEVAEDVSFRVDLTDGSLSDGKIRLDELTKDSDSIFNVTLSRDDTENDLRITGLFEVAGLLPGLDAPFDLIDARVQFTWTDVAPFTTLFDPGNFSIQVVPGSVGGELLEYSGL